MATARSISIKMGMFWVVSDSWKCGNCSETTAEIFRKKEIGVVFKVFPEVDKLESDKKGFCCDLVYYNSKERLRNGIWCVERLISVLTT